jgi:hemoglobin
LKNDIASRADVKLLVDTFYEKVQVNPVIGYIFTDVAKVDWQHHLPKMYNFWSAIILGDQSYVGNPSLMKLLMLFLRDRLRKRLKTGRQTSPG